MQSYQQVTVEVQKELDNFKGNDIHVHFYKLKQQFPERFERLLFDTNGELPFSEDLEQILLDLYLSGEFFLND